jgi:hypothetical protein
LEGGSGDQIALKDGKQLLVVQYICRTKMAAVPAASDDSFFAVAKVTLSGRRDQAIAANGRDAG